MKKQTKKKKLDNKKILILGIILIFIIAITTIILILRPQKATIIPSNEERETSNLVAKNTYNENIEVNMATVNATTQDTSGILVKDGAIVAIRESLITKYDGLISNSEKALETGLNSAMIVSYGSEAKLSNNSKVESSVEYSNAIYISGKKAKLTIIDSKINTYAYKSSGIVVSTSGTLEMDHSDITTKFKSSPLIYVKDQEGTATITNSNLESNGLASPVIRTSGNVEITNTTGIANGSNFALIEDGKLNLKTVTLIASGANDTEDILPSGFNIINSSSKVELSISDSSLNVNKNLPYYKSAVMFQVINSETEINLKNAQLNFGSGYIASISKSNTIINCDSQNLEGKITLDDTSTLNLVLSNNSIFYGTLTSNKTKLSLDTTSKLILRENTYLTELTNEDQTNSNIVFNNYKLYVNGKEITKGA